MRVGVIVEYNPFHNGHKIHLQKIKELYPESTIIAAMSGNFVQRGEPSFINKYERTKLALSHEVDLVVEIPPIYVLQSANLFAYGAIKTLDFFDVDVIVYGSESVDVKKMSNAYHENQHFDHSKNYFNNVLDGDFKSNDILGIEYIKNIKLLNSKIIPVAVKREAVEYNALKSNGDIASATLIRKLVFEGQKVDDFLPIYNIEWKFNQLSNYFNALKVKIITEDLTNYQDVNVEVASLLKKHIASSLTLEDLLDKCKTKRISKSKLQRCLAKIMLNITTERFEVLNNEFFINMLGYNAKGMLILKDYRKKIANLEKASGSLLLNREINHIYNMFDTSYLDHKVIIAD